MGYDLEKIPLQTSPHSTYQDYLDADSRDVPKRFRSLVGSSSGCARQYSAGWQKCCRVMLVPEQLAATQSPQTVST